MECHFSLEIQTPDGLKNMDKDFQQADLNLRIWESGYNGKNILRSNPAGLIELDMDSSDDDILFGSGRINAEFEKAKTIISEISRILERNGYKHTIIVDDESDENTFHLFF